MGTLGNQAPRKSFSVSFDILEAFIQDAVDIAKKYSVSVENVLYAKHVLELERKNNIAVEHGDYLDEQAAGIGEVLSSIASALEDRE